MTTIADFNTLGSHIVNGEELRPDAKDPMTRIDSLNPYSGEVLWSGQTATPATIDKAVLAARSSFPAWAQVPFAERLKLLQKFVELVQTNAAILTEVIAQEAGKPIWESKLEVNSLVTKLAASVDAYHNRVAESSRDVKGLCSRTRFQPHGVMAVLGPFNFPASMANSHIMPALLAGNTVVFKPSELTPAIGMIVSRLWQIAGLPVGVMNCITGGKLAGEYLVNHPGVDGVLLVGSYSAGMSILKSLVESPQKVVALEMGGNSPLVVWDYDELDPVVNIVIQSAFLSSGQRCSAARRLILKSDDTTLIPRLASVLRNLTIGDIRVRPEPFYGPLIRPSAASKVLQRSTALISSGADPILEPTLQGPFQTVMTPGLLGMDNCTNDMDEEIFGPILKIYRVHDFEEAIRLSNNTKFGLAAGLVCRDRDRFERFFHSVKAGIVNWNQQLTGATTLAPFGGVKHSGNYRPAGFLSADYCSYAVASFEVEQPRLPATPAAGITF